MQVSQFKEVLQQLCTLGTLDPRDPLSVDQDKQLQGHGDAHLTAQLDTEGVLWQRRMLQR